LSFGWYHRAAALGKLRLVTRVSLSPSNIIW